MMKAFVFFCSVSLGIFMLLSAASAQRADKVISARGGEEFVFNSSKTPEGREYGYFVPANQWPADFDGWTVIYVCWEEPSKDFERERERVRSAIQSSWQRYAKIEFRGWQTCAAQSRGIRIHVADVGPHTKGLGTALDGMPQGMVLNFTFSAWSPDCADPSLRDACIKSIAVHEFGHAIGFAHEHNRPDIPGECKEAPQGSSEGAVMLTPYDLRSVMNYCNPVYNNNGELSPLDIDALQQRYGKGR